MSCLIFVRLFWITLYRFVLVQKLKLFLLLYLQEEQGVGPTEVKENDQSRFFFFVLIFLLFRHKISEFRINCFKFTQYFAKIVRLIFIIILESFVTYASKLISLYVNISQQLNKMYKIYFQLNYFMIFWKAKMKQVWWNKIYSIQLL